MNKTRREYEAEVYYQVWRSGGNPDRINLDRVEDSRYNGDSEDDCACQELRRMRQKHEEEAANDN